MGILTDWGEGGPGWGQEQGKGNYPHRPVNRLLHQIGFHQLLTLPGCRIEPITAGRIHILLRQSLQPPWAGPGAEFPSAKVMMLGQSATPVVLLNPLDRAFLRVPCPRCQYEIAVRFRLAVLGDVVFCPCCKARIQFSDDGASGHKSRRSIHNALEDLQREIANLNRSLTIET